MSTQSICERYERASQLEDLTSNQRDAICAIHDAGSLQRWAGQSHIFSERSGSKNFFGKGAILILESLVRKGLVSKSTVSSYSTYSDTPRISYNLNFNGRWVAARLMDPNTPVPEFFYP